MRSAGAAVRRSATTEFGRERSSVLPTIELEPGLRKVAYGQSRHTGRREGRKESPAGGQCDHRAQSGRARKFAVLRSAVTKRQVDHPFWIAISPDQTPTAAFTAGSATLGQATSFDASASSDRDGTVARYQWSFGDGQSASTSSSTTTHVRRGRRLHRDADRHRQRRLLDHTDLHRTDDVLPGLRIRADPPAGRARAGEHRGSTDHRGERDQARAARLDRQLGRRHTRLRLSMDTRRRADPRRDHRVPTPSGSPIRVIR